MSKAQEAIPKTMKRLWSLVGKLVEVTLVSNSEVLIRGILDSFLLNDQIRIVTIDNGLRFLVINWENISTMSIQYPQEEQ